MNHLNYAPRGSYQQLPAEYWQNMSHPYFTSSVVHGYGTPHTTGMPFTASMSNEPATPTFVPETQLSDRESPIGVVNLEKAISNAEGIRKRSSWTKVEDEVLARSFVTISDNPIIGNDQKADAFWGQVASYYNENLPLCSNTRNANVIRDEDILRFAYEKYLSENNGVAFNLEHIWRIVKDRPMFTPQSADHFVATKKTRTLESGASNTSSNQDFTEYTSVKKSEVDLKQKQLEVEEIKAKAALSKSEAKNRRLKLKDSSSNSSSTSEDEVHVEIDEQAYDPGEELMLSVLQQHQQLIEAYQRRDTRRRRYMRRSNADDVQRLLQMHDERHGFPGMLGSLDCMHWKWKNCPVAWKVCPCLEDFKRKLFKERHESTRKDVERTFGLLQSRWTIVRGPARRCRSISAMLLSARQPQSSAPHGLVFSGFYSAPPRRTSLALSRPSVVLCRASYLAAVNTETGRGSSSWDDLRLSSDGGTRCIKQSDLSNFDPLGLYKERTLGLGSFWESVLDFFSLTFESTSSPKKDRSSLKRGAAAAIEDSSIDIGDFFKGPLPGKFLKLLGYLALSRLGVYVPLGGVNREAFAGNLDQNSLLSTLDSFSGGGIGRLGICSLGIVPFINAQIVFQLLTQIYPKLQDLQKREGEAGRKKVLQYTRYASVGFAVVQVREILFIEAFGFGIPDLVSFGAMLNCSIATKEIKAIGQVLFLRPYVNDFSTEWAVSSIVLLTLGSVFTTYIGERISDLKLGNGTSLLIFTSIISYLPASFGRTVAQAFQDGNYLGLAAIIFSFFLLVLGIVYVQEAERKIPLNYASRYTTGGLQKSAYLPFKVNSSGVMPIIFSTSSLALPGTLARFTGVTALKKAALALNPGGSLYLPTNILLIAFFNYYYTFLQLDPDDVSEQLKRQGASVPLVRPGKSTSAFLKTVLSRISVLGSAFLAVLAAGPSVIEQTTHLTAFRGFAGTSVLILVGCATDTARKVQAEIISQKYKNIEFYDINQ
ncbi:hypothetical protein ZIOFF_072627 [Zingiber officinale]|uniref:CpSecY n=1 Tax=Zingiber officinale TaxID=94328 RepID=A0A8J5ENT6_ZINOF|nr:hypothetical protein ZIOFF_072627 [Zingiber officinale]